VKSKKPMILIKIIGFLHSLEEKTHIGGTKL